MTRQFKNINDNSVITINQDQIETILNDDNATIQSEICAVDGTILYNPYGNIGLSEYKEITTSFLEVKKRIQDTVNNIPINLINEMGYSGRNEFLNDKFWFAYLFVNANTSIALADKAIKELGNDI